MKYTYLSLLAFIGLISQIYSGRKEFMEFSHKKNNPTALKIFELNVQKLENLHKYDPQMMVDNIKFYIRNNKIEEAREWLCFLNLLFKIDSTIGKFTLAHKEEFQKKYNKLCNKFEEIQEPITTNKNIKSEQDIKRITIGWCQEIIENNRLHNISSWNLIFEIPISYALSDKTLKENRFDELKKLNKQLKMDDIA